MQTEEVAKPLKYNFFSSNDPDRLWEVKSRIDSFYRENAKFFAELENEVDDAYNRQMAGFIIDSAINIRTTFRCPRGWREGLPWINMFPPAPQPEQMRNGLLTKGISETGPVRAMVDEVEAGQKYKAFAQKLKEQLRHVSRAETAMDEGGSVGEEDDDYADEEDDTAMNVDEEQESAHQVVAMIDGRDGGRVIDERVAPEPQQTRQSTAVDFGNFGDDDDDDE